MPNGATGRGGGVDGVDVLAASAEPVGVPAFPAAHAAARRMGESIAHGDRRMTAG